jgi:hypothetical protein
MHNWPKVSIVVAVLLAGAGAFYRLVPGIEQARTRSAAVDDCLQAVRMAYDVQWAAACATQGGQGTPGQADGHAECDLPDAKAAIVNAWLDQDEQRCVAEMRAGLDRWQK